MNHLSHAGHQPALQPHVPFVHSVAPIFYAGEAIYFALEVSGRLIGRGFAVVRTRVREAQAVATLKCLDDRTLNDIGIRRSQIGHVAHLVARNRGIDYRTWCQSE